MKGKYITTLILLACLSKPVSVKKEKPAEVRAVDKETKSFGGRKAA